MKTILNFTVIAVAFAASPTQGFALWGLHVVSKEQAKELDLVVSVSETGPNHFIVELDVSLKGDLKRLSHVELRVGKGDNPPVTASLREDRSEPEHVVVRFTVDRAKADDVELWAMVPAPLGGTIYVVRPKDFVPPRKGR